LRPPANVAVAGTTPDSIRLGWSAADGAAGYLVYRDGVKVTATAVNATWYLDTGLLPGTRYSYRVSSTGAAGGESTRSAAVTGITSAAFTCSVTTSSNYDHVRARRAHDSGGFARANGSDQNMGLDNIFNTTTLAQTMPGYYVIGLCP
jgi:poly(3-hydroxybutyrate) depolymerase